MDSYYFEDDDDPYAPLQSQQQQQQHHSLQCSNCGGTDFYQDDETTMDVCATCNLESQQSQPAGEMTLDEVAVLAAKNKGGTFQTRKPHKRRKFVSEKIKQPLEELDASVSLPDLETCVSAFQQVLHECAERLVVLVGWTDSNNSNHTAARNVLRRTLRKLWSDYLIAWRDGAQHYGRMYPKIRFSLRDAFLPAQHLGMILNTLSYVGIQKSRQELTVAAATREEDTDDGRIDADDTRVDTHHVPLPDDDIQSNPDQEFDATTDRRNHPAAALDKTSFAKQELRKKRLQKALGSRNSKIMFLLGSHNNYQAKEYYDAALGPHAQPSMTMAAALLWLSIYRAGVTASQMVHWIRSGALPLLNSFGLIQQQSAALRSIASFFQMYAPPTTTQLEIAATQLAVACRLRNDADLTMHDRLSSLRFVTDKNVCVVVAQLVADLHLGQGVCDRCLSLMGICNTTNSAQEDEDDAAIPRCKLQRTEDVVALIALACFLDPEWRTWKYVRPKMTTTDRFVPWSEEQVGLVTNGASMQAYLDFMEESVLINKEAVIPELVESFKNDGNTRQTSLLEISIDDKEADQDESHPVQPSRFAGGLLLEQQQPLRTDLYRQYQIVRDASTLEFKDPKRQILIECLAHATHLEPVVVQASLNKLME
jgi:hypothetical protein